VGTITIRQVQGEEKLDSVFPLTEYAFRPTPPRPRDELAKALPAAEEKVVLVLFDDDQPMATASYWPMTQNVRGVVLPMAGVASVATAPLGRRRGYARGLMTRLLEVMHEQAFPVSVLYPFRPSFYARFGWASFPPRHIIQVGPASLTPLLRLDLAGEFTHRPLKEGVDDYHAFLTALQPEAHGLSLFSAARTRRAAAESTRWLVTARHEGEIVGVMTYRLTEDGEMHTDDFLYRMLHGRYVLLQWVARHIDQVKHAWLRVGPDETAETWVDDHDVVVHTEYSRHHYYEPMGRVVSVERLTGLPAGAGAFTARVRDDQCPWNAGTYRFEGVDGRLVVGRATATPACDLTIHGLSALVYTGHDPADFRYRGWGDPPPDTQRAMREIFPPARPYVYEGF
jgi:predicted N-acetyltransferase YhbS